MTKHRQDCALWSELQRGGTRALCSVCGGYDNSLTSDCPGERISVERLQEICETPLDYTDDRGWHQRAATQPRSPRFVLPVAHSPRREGVTITGCSCGWRAPHRGNSDIAFTAHYALATIVGDPPIVTLAGGTADLREELARKAVAWVLADQACEDLSIELARLEDEVAARGQPQHEQARERVRVEFHLADVRAQTCDDEFRQAARKLAAARASEPQHDEDGP